MIPVLYCKAKEQKKRRNMNKKLKIALIALLAAMTWNMVGCDTPKQKEIKKQKREMAEKAELNRMADSLLANTEYNKLRQEILSDDSVSVLQQELDSLTATRYQASRMLAQIEQQLNVSLEKYLNRITTNMRGCKSYDQSETKAILMDMLPCAIALGCTDVEIESLVYNLDAAVNSSLYTDDRKENIKQNNREIIKGFLADAQNIVEKNKKQFAAYYPVLDLDKIPEKYRQDCMPANKSFIIEQMENGCALGTDLSMPTSVRVLKTYELFAKGFNEEFFSDRDAEYQAVSVAKNKWQVVRTGADGKIEKSPVFQSNAKSFTDFDYNGMGEHFNYIPMDNGIKISATQIVYEKHPVKDAYIKNNAREAKIKKLQNRLEKNDSMKYRMMCMQDSVRVIARAQMAKHR